MGDYRDEYELRSDLIEARAEIARLREVGDKLVSAMRDAGFPHQNCESCEALDDALTEWLALDTQAREGHGSAD